MTVSAEVTSYIVIIYLNRLIGIVGVVLNLLGLIVMSNKSLIHPIYMFLWCRQLCNLIVCILACGWVEPLAYEAADTYGSKVYMYFLIAVPLRISFFTSAISDVILILNRYFIITDQKVFLLRISKLTNIAMCFTLPLSLCILYFFSHEIVQVEKNRFVLRLNEFGESKLYHIYAWAIYILKTFVGVLLLGFLNALSVKKFREKMIRKGHLLKNETSTKRAEVVYTKMVFILTTICLVTRSIDALVGILVRLMTLRIIRFSAAVES